MKQLPKLAAESVGATLSRKGPAIGEALAARYAPARTQEPPPPSERGILDETDAAIMSLAQREVSQNLAIHSTMFAPPSYVPFATPEEAPPRRLSDLIL